MTKIKPYFRDGDENKTGLQKIGKNRKKIQLMSLMSAGLRKKNRFNGLYFFLFRFNPDCINQLCFVTILLFTFLPEYILHHPCPLQIIGFSIFTQVNIRNPTL